MKRERLTVAIAGDVTFDGDAGLGFGLAIRRVLGRRIRMVGLCRQSPIGETVTDAGFDEIVVMPRTADGRESYREMLREVEGRYGLDVLLVEGETELETFQCLSDELRSLRILTAMPTRTALERSTTGRLRSFAREVGISAPESVAVSDVLGVAKAVKKLGLPVVVRSGRRAVDVAPTRAAAERVVNQLRAEGVCHITLQEFIHGEQYEVAVARDAQGTTCVCVTMHKTLVTRSDDAWAGATVDDPAIKLFAETVTDGLLWHGPCQLMIVKDRQSRLFITGVKPCLPRWSYVAASEGVNLPLLTLYLAMGKRLKSPYAACSGLYYVRQPAALARELVHGAESFGGHDFDSAHHAYMRGVRISSSNSSLVNLESSI